MLGHLHSFGSVLLKKASKGHKTTLCSVLCFTVDATNGRCESQEVNLSSMFTDDPVDLDWVC